MIFLTIAICSNGTGLTVGFINSPPLITKVDITQYTDKLIAEEGVIFLPGTLSIIQITTSD